MTSSISGNSSQDQINQLQQSTNGSSADEAQFIEQYITMLQDIQQTLDATNAQDETSQAAEVQSVDAANISVQLNAQAEQDPTQIF